MFLFFIAYRMEPLQELFYPFDPMSYSETWWEKHQYDYDEEEEESVYETTDSYSDDCDSQSANELQR